MSENNAFGFVKFVPGFDFLQNLAKGAAGTMPQLPQLSNWVAPTMNVEELDKRITELKSVQFWLEQNARALAATVQALEVQKMTLATLQGMNFSMGDMANAFKIKADETVASVTSAAQAFSEKIEKPSAAASSAQTASDAGLIDPLQWWGALTSQFQQIAGNALKDVARNGAVDMTHNAAADLAKEAFKTATDMASQFAAKGVQSMQEAAAGMTAVVPPAAVTPAPATKSAAKKAAATPKTPAATTATSPAKKAATRRASGKPLSK